MSRLFAGTQFDRPVTCEVCSQPVAVCKCPRGRLSGAVLKPADQPLRIRREQRRGKFVTVITGFAQRSAKSDDLPDVVKKLKSSLGVGGTLDSGDGVEPVIELQGDHRDKLVEHFKKLGYPAKAAGG
jgi:translation initiation factor 1